MLNSVSKLNSFCVFFQKKKCETILISHNINLYNDYKEFNSVLPEGCTLSKLLLKTEN